MSTTDIGSYVVTGGAHGVGRAIAERLARDGHVVVLDPGAAADGWIRETARVTGVAGDAGDDSVAAEAAGRAADLAPLRGWVNNAAVFRDNPLGRPGRPDEVAGRGCCPAVGRDVVRHRCGAPRRRRPVRPRRRPRSPQRHPNRGLGTTIRMTLSAGQRREISQMMIARTTSAARACFQ